MSSSTWPPTNESASARVGPTPNQPGYQGQQSGYGPPPPGYGAAPQVEKNTDATLAMWLGIGSWLTCGLSGIPALIVGLKAKKEIAAQPGRYANGNQATVGVVLGSLGTGFLALALVGLVLGSSAHPQASTVPSASAASAVLAPTSPDGSPSPALTSCASRTCSTKELNAELDGIELDPVNLKDREAMHKKVSTLLASANPSQPVALGTGAADYLVTPVRWRTAS